MSYKNRNNVTNRVGGTGVGSKAGQGIYEESSTAKFAIGEKLEFADGRVFRYGYTAAAINAAELVSQDVSAATVPEADNIVIAAANGFSPAAGSLKLQTTLAGKTEDQFAGGLLHVCNDGGDGIGEGIQYRIKSNSATGATTSGKVDWYLYDPIKVTLTTASDVAVTGSLWNHLRATSINLSSYSTADDYIISGVTPIAFTANYYGWFQTAGIALISCDGNVQYGSTLQMSDSDAGHVQLRNSETQPVVGFAAFSGDDDAHIGVVLQGLVP